MNAVIYARYSSDNQREESIEGQLRECKNMRPTGRKTQGDILTESNITMKTPTLTLTMKKIFP